MLYLLQGLAPSAMYYIRTTKENMGKSINSGQWLQVRWWYGIKNEAAIVLQCKSNVKLNGCLTLYCI